MNRSDFFLFSHTWKYMVISAFLKCISKPVLFSQGKSLMGERRRSWNSCAFPHKSAETWSGLSIQISKCTEIHSYQHFLQTIKFKSLFVITLWNTVTYFLPFSPPATTQSCQYEHFLYWDFGNLTHSWLSNPWHLAILMDRNCSKQCYLESKRKVCAQLWKFCL